MGSQLFKSQSGFSFIFDGKNEIDALILSKTISDMAQLTKLAAAEECPDAYLKMSVTALKDGSFHIDFSAICEISESLLNTAVTTAGKAAIIIGAVKGFFEIKKLTKGEKPKKITDKPNNLIEIEDNTGIKVEVPKSSGAIITNVQIDQLVVNISEYVKEHNPSGGFVLSTSEGASAYTADDVKNMSKSYPEIEQAICQRYRLKVELPIRKADLLRNSAWEFIYKDKTIKATIQDEEFIGSVHRGDIQLKAMDYINALMEIYVDLDALGNPIDKTAKYTIVEVIGEIKHGYPNHQVTLSE